MPEEKKLDLSALKIKGSDNPDQATSYGGSEEEGLDDSGKVLISLDTIKKANEKKKDDKKVTEEEGKTKEPEKEELLKQLAEDDKTISSDKVEETINLNIGKKQDSEGKDKTKDALDEDKALFSNYNVPEEERVKPETDALEKDSDSKEESKSIIKKETSKKENKEDVKKAKKKKLIKRLLMGGIPLLAIAIGFGAFLLFQPGEDIGDKGKADSLGAITDGTGAIQDENLGDNLTGAIDEVNDEELVDDIIDQDEVDKEQAKKDKIRNFLKNNYSK